MSERFLCSRDVAERVGLSKTEIYRRIAAGTFPQQVPLGTQRVAFVESEIDAWMAQRLKARDAKEGAAERRERAADAEARKHKSRRHGRVRRARRK